MTSRPPGQELRRRSARPQSRRVLRRHISCGTPCPERITLTRTYDARNRLTGVTDWTGRATTFTYDSANRLLTTTRANGTVRTNTWDAAGQLTAANDRHTASGVPVVALRIAYDAAGRLTDKLELPTSPSAPALPARNATYNSDNQLTAFNGQAIGHDADGNITSAPAPTGVSPLQSYGWNTRNQLGGAPGGLTFGYDAEGLRTARTQSGQTTTFVNDPHGPMSRVLCRVRPDGTRTFYIYGPILLHEIEESASGGNPANAARHYHYDHLGSTIALSNDAGQPVARANYSAYGILTQSQGALNTPFLWQGAFGVQTDPNGLHHMRARYYHAYLSRFLSEDPLGFAGGSNFYAYANGDPIMNVDPSGTIVETVWDVANLGMGAYSLQDNVRKGNWGWAALDTVGLIYDGAATAVPFLPAGVSAAFKASRAGNTLVHSVNAGRDVANIAEQTHQVAKTFAAVNDGTWRAAHDGTQIHKQVAAATGDSMHYFDATFMGGGANRISGKQPDMIGQGVWADITTLKRWDAHVAKYQHLGENIPILYERGRGVVNSFRLLPGAGVANSIK